MKIRGFSLLEIMVVLAIVGGLAALVAGNLSGLKSSDSVDRAAQQVYEDLIYIRARSISTSKTHRIRWASDTLWSIEYYDTSLTTPAWVPAGATRQMPTNTYLMSGSLTNAGSNLEATSRGIYQFQNGKSGSPYISIQGLGVSKIKSLYVDAGGAVEIRTQ